MDKTIHEGITFYRAGRYPQALTQLLSASPSSTQDASDLAYYAGLTYMQLKRYEDALPHLEQIVTEGISISRIRQCRLLLCVIYCLTGRQNLADFELRKLIDSGYTTAAVYSALAYIACEQAKVDECLSYYEKALSEDPSLISALNGLGYVLANSGKDISRALSLCKKAVELAPNSPACLDSLGWVYFKMGLFKEAKEFLRKARDKSGDDDKEITEHLTTVISQEKLAIENSRMTDMGEARK
ncbi:MAG: tetratricopeptide repeat protein [Treponemataceae bacterium]|nr:MAG: tetratricopeptide repeat protein [Treponemataceae bacterium]